MIQGREFLEVRRFLDGMVGEASARTRTGRAYYAAYLETRGYCERNLDFQRGRSAGDRAKLAQVIAGVDAGLAGNLENLRRLRNTADYDMEADPEDIIRDVMLSGVLARSIISRLDEMTAIRTAKVVTSVPEEPEDE